MERGKPLAKRIANQIRAAGENLTNLNKTGAKPPQPLGEIVPNLLAAAAKQTIQPKPEITLPR
jgi:hypothetical protein